jgi:hypothetical protein
VIARREGSSVINPELRSGRKNRGDGQVAAGGAVRGVSAAPSARLEIFLLWWSLDLDLRRAKGFDTV